MGKIILARAALCALIGSLGHGSAAWATEPPTATVTADAAMDVRESARGLIVTPGSTRDRRPGFAHTNHHVLVPLGQPMAAASPSGHGETPASLACVYGLTAPVPGCNPRTLTTVATGGSRTIAIVDAYHYPTAASDLATFSAQYGLPAITSQNFQVVYAAGTQPPVDPTGGWELEAALDIEMAHALAPGATIVLVEAASASSTDLLPAVVAAAKRVARTGGEISLSWSTAEFAVETLFQPQFSKSGVVVFAATGDQPGTAFPSVLPNVVAVGGTTIQRDASYNYVAQTTWTSAGSGLSRYVGRPGYQSGVSSVVHTARGTPDIALVADPTSPVWAYNSTAYNGSPPGWFQIGGTSVATPLAAALVNAAGTFKASTATELTAMYQAKAIAADFTDIVAGTCGSGGTLGAKIGYDLCTGIGAPFGTGAK